MEYTHLLCTGKYHCSADLHIDRFGFSCFAYVELDTEIQSGGQPYSDTFPYKVSESSLDYL